MEFAVYAGGGSAPEAGAAPPALYLVSPPLEQQQQQQQTAFVAYSPTEASSGSCGGQQQHQAYSSYCPTDQTLFPDQQQIVFQLGGGGLAHVSPGQCSTDSGYATSQGQYFNASSSSSSSDVILSTNGSDNANTGGFGLAQSVDSSPYTPRPPDASEVWPGSSRSVAEATDEDLSDIVDQVLNSIEEVEQDKAGAAYSGQQQQGQMDIHSYLQPGGGASSPSPAQGAPKAMSSSSSSVDEAFFEQGSLMTPARKPQVGVVEPRVVVKIPKTALYEPSEDSSSGQQQQQQQQVQSFCVKQTLPESFKLALQNRGFMHQEDSSARSRLHRRDQSGQLSWSRRRQAHLLRSSSKKCSALVAPMPCSAGPEEEEAPFLKASDLPTFGALAAAFAAREQQAKAAEGQPGQQQRLAKKAGKKRRRRKQEEIKQKIIKLAMEKVSTEAQNSKDASTNTPQRAPEEEEEQDQASPKIPPTFCKLSLDNVVYTRRHQRRLQEVRSGRKKKRKARSSLEEDDDLPVLDKPHAPAPPMGAEAGPDSEGEGDDPPPPLLTPEEPVSSPPPRPLATSSSPALPVLEVGARERVQKKSLKSLTQISFTEDEPSKAPSSAPVPSSARDDIEWLFCEVVGCAFWTSKPERMERHKLFHYSPCSKNFKCPDCGDRFFSLAKMLKHDRKQHTGVKDYECRLCGVEVTDITIHMRVHMTDKLYQCQACPMQFRHKNSLVRHMYQHTGERPFRCQVSGCQQAFTVKDRLREHMRKCHPDEVVPSPVVPKVSRALHNNRTKPSTPSSNPVVQVSPAGSLQPQQPLLPQAAVPGFSIAYTDVTTGHTLLVPWDPQASGGLLASPAAGELPGPATTALILPGGAAGPVQYLAPSAVPVAPTGQPQQGLEVVQVASSPAPAPAPAASKPGLVGLAMREILEEDGEEDEEELSEAEKKDEEDLLSQLKCAEAAFHETEAYLKSFSEKLSALSEQRRQVMQLMQQQKRKGSSSGGAGFECDRCGRKYQYKDFLRVHQRRPCV